MAIHIITNNTSWNLDFVNIKTNGDNKPLPAKQPVDVGWVWVDTVNNDVDFEHVHLEIRYNGNTKWAIWKYGDLVRASQVDQFDANAPQINGVATEGDHNDINLVIDVDPAVKNPTPDNTTLTSYRR